MPLQVMRMFYAIVRFAFEAVFGRQQMLHYPLYVNDDQTLLQGQMYFTDRCLSYLPDLGGKRLLDIGCGNGVQALYIHDAYKPQYVCGIDINEMHVRQASAEKAARDLHDLDFAVDNAQHLISVEDDSFDVAICIESAHHYADKRAFLRQVHRVLRPGGYVLVADLVRRDGALPNALERKLSLCYWPVHAYREAFASLQLALVKEDELTNSVLPAFRATDKWFTAQSQSRGLSYRLGRLFGRLLVALYTYELKYRFRYCVFVAQKL